VVDQLPKREGSGNDLRQSGYTERDPKAVELIVPVPAFVTALKARERSVVGGPRPVPLARGLEPVKTGVIAPHASRSIPADL
jgi:hypothetical protein